MSFNVRDYGATGDGHTDDGPAIQKSIDAAVAAGPGSDVLLPAGRYLFGADPRRGSSAVLVNRANGLTIRGEKGTVLIAPPEKSFFRVQASTDVSIRSLTLDRAPLSYAQATIVSFDPTRKSAVVTFNPGYADFTSPVIEGATFFVIFSDPQSGTWGDHSADCAWLGPNDPGACWPPTIIGHRRLDETRWEVDLNHSPVEHDVGKVVSLWNLTKKGYAFNIVGTKTFTAEDIHYYPGGAGGAFVLNRNSGDFTFRRMIVDVKPGSDQLISALGGTMVFNNHIALTLDHVTIARVWDDGFNMGANFARIARQDHPRQITVDVRQANDWRVGDTVAVWDWLSKSERERARVIDVACDPAEPDFCKLTFDSDVQIQRTGVLPIKNRVNDNDGIDRVIDLDSAGRLHVANSSFQSLHARGLLIKTSNSTIENSEIHDTVMAGLLIGPEFSWDEGPTVENLTVRNNTFNNVSGSNVLVQSEASTTPGNKQIQIVGNRFLSFGRYHHGIMGDPGTPIMMHNVDHGTVSGNSGSPSAGHGDLRVDVDRSDKVEVR